MEEVLKFEIEVDLQNEKTIIRDSSGTEQVVSLEFTLIDCIKLVLKK